MQTCSLSRRNCAVQSSLWGLKCKRDEAVENDDDDPTLQVQIFENMKKTILQ